MFGYQIKKILQSDPVTKPFFRGIFASDTIEDGNFLTDFNTNNIFICNTSLSTHKVGVHWVLIFKNAEKTVFVDVLRRPIEFYPREIVEFLGENYETVPFMIMHSSANLCGYYSCFFARYLSADIPLNRIMAEFGHNTVHNDNYLMRWVKKYLSKYVPICGLEDGTGGVQGQKCLSLDDYYHRLDNNKI